MTDQTDIIDEIRGWHRRRRFAMKVQQKLDRSLESFFRRNATDWDPNADETSREKANQKVKALIKSIRDGAPHEFAKQVAIVETARAPADEERAECEKKMEALAMRLPVYPWVKNINGAGEGGLATIVAEAGDLSIYSKPCQLWKRLGFAPYDGHAGSTWKRVTWRPRALTSEEWTDNPFSGERYALIFMLAESMFRKQWIGVKKTGTGEGKPNGPYGEVYKQRRDHTKVMHPDWSDGHAKRDALRIMMKRFLKDLWIEWNRDLAKPEQRAKTKARGRQRDRVATTAPRPPSS